jgi:hypothetical protein
LKSHDLGLLETSKSTDSNPFEPVDLTPLIPRFLPLRLIVSLG